MAADHDRHTGDAAVDAALAQWLRWDKNPATRQQLLSLADQKDVAQLSKLLLQRMEFGTAGLRAAMAAGNSRMNDLTVIQAAQGLCAALDESVPNARDMGIVLGHDHRRNSYGCSQTFAKLTAAVFVGRGFKVMTFDRVVCTPFVPFAVRHYGAAAGVMVTASHNPKDDNGYKVYWTNGAQIIQPYDTTIATAIDANLAPWFDVWQALQGIDTKVTNIFEQCQASYMAACVRASAPPARYAVQVPFVYTAMHGVGGPFVQHIFEQWNLHPVVTVQEQLHPDPTFPTVSFPNPEEGKSALNLAMALADSKNISYILANDPDADRLAVAQKLTDGTWHVFKGNETGSLLAWWLWRQHSARGGSAKRCAMIASTVSSKFIENMAKVEGFHYEETLTGFKWMGNKAQQLEDEGYQVLLAFEEAIGFMVGTAVLDKDGVHAAAVVGHMVNTLAAEGSSLACQLEALYTKYGYFVSYDSYFLCHEPKTLAAIFNAIRPTYPATMGGFTLHGVRDMTTGYDSRQSDRVCRLPLTPQAQMVTFYFDNGAVMTVRGSGTEPKLKYYSEIHGRVAGCEDKAELVGLLETVVGAVIDHFLQPAENGLLPQPA